MYFIDYLRIKAAIYLFIYFKHLENLILSVFECFFSFLLGFLYLNGFVQMIYNSWFISGFDRIMVPVIPLDINIDFRIIYISNFCAIHLI